METMHFQIAHTKCFRTISFRIKGVPMNSFAPMINFPGVQGSLNWMPEYKLQGDMDTVECNSFRSTRTLEISAY